MAKSFVEQFQTRTGTFAPTAPAPSTQDVPAKVSIIDKVKSTLGIKPAAPAYSPTPVNNPAPSLYDQNKGIHGAAPSFLEQFNARTGIFSGAPADKGVAPASHESGKMASMASYLDLTPAHVRTVGEEAAKIAEKPAGSPFTLKSPTPSMGFDWTKPNTMIEQLPPKPQVTLPSQQQLDNPKIAKAYRDAVAAVNEPRPLVVKLQEGYDAYTESLGHFAENVAIGETATAQSLLDFLGVYAPKVRSVKIGGSTPGTPSLDIPTGDIGENIGAGARDIANHLQDWLDRVQTPETIASGLNEADAKAKVDELAKQGKKAIITQIDAPRALSLYDQKAPTYDVALPKYGELTDQLAQGVGSSAVFFLPGLGVARAAEVLGTVSPKLAMIFGNSASAAIEAMTESGNIYRADVAAGVGTTKAEADATKSFWANAILVGLTNHFGAFNPETSGFIRRMVMSSPIEGVQEAAQTMIQNKLQGNDILDGAGSSFLIGAIIGGVMGGGIETLTGESGGQSVTKPNITGEAPQMQEFAPGATPVSDPVQVPTSDTVAAPGPQEAAQPDTQAATDSEVKRVAGNLLKNNPGISQTDAEAMARDVIKGREFSNGAPVKQATVQTITPAPTSVAPKDVKTEQQFHTYLQEAYPDGLTLYHETTPEVAQEIAKDGFSGNNSEDENVYFVANQDAAGRNPSGGGAIIAVHIPKEALVHIYPDENTYGFSSNTAPYNDTAAQDLMQSHDGITGADVVVPAYEIKKDWITTSPQTYANSNSFPNTADDIASEYFSAVIEPMIGTGKTIEVAGDVMKAYFNNDYAPERSNMYSQASYSIIQKLIEHPDLQTYVFLGGGPGSGKSEFIGNRVKATDAAHVLYDSSFSSADGIGSLIDTAKEKGKDVQVRGILADLTRAWGFTKTRATTTGRAVAPEAFVRGHIGFIDTLKTLLTDGTITNEQVQLTDLREAMSYDEAAGIIDSGTVVENVLDTVGKIAYTADYVQGITSGTSSGGDLGTGSGQGGGAGAQGDVSGNAGEVLILTPEDLTKKISIETQRLIKDNAGTAAGLPDIAAKTAKNKIKKNVVIQGKSFDRPDTVVIKAELRAVLKDIGGAADFTVQEDSGQKMLVYSKDGTTMKFKPSALGLIDENLKPGQTVRASYETLGEKGTTFRAVGSSGALAFNMKNLGLGIDSKEFTAETDKIVKRSEIASNLAKELGVPVRTGHFKDKALGIFKPWAHVIRLKSKLGDIRIPVLVHESAHYIDYTLFGEPTKTKQGKSWVTTEFVSDKIPRAELDPLLQEYGGVPNSKKREAFAEFIRYWVTEPAKAAERAPKFLQIWENEILPGYPEVRDILLTTRADWQRYLQMPAVAKVVSQISFGENKKTFADYKDAVVKTWHDSLAQWTDDLYPLRRFTMMARDRNVAINLENDPYILARLSRGWVGKASTFLEKGTFDTHFWKEVNGKSEPLFTGKGLAEIIAPAVNEHNMENFSAFLVSKRAIELNAREIHSGINDNVAKQALAELTAKHPEFAAMAKELDAYQTALLKYVYSSGLISEQTMVQMRKMNSSYVPFFRVMEEAQTSGLAGRSMVDLSSPVKRIKGSDRDIVNPLESIVKNTYALINAAERNRVGIAMVNLSKTHPELNQLFEKIPDEQTKVASVKINDLIEQVSGGQGGMMLITAMSGGQVNPGKAQNVLGELGEKIVNIFRPSFFHDNNVLTVMIAGKPQSFHVEPEIYKALQGSELEDVGVIWKLLSYPARWLRAGATLTPEFIVRNPARDLISAFVYSNYGFMPPIDPARGLYGMYAKDNAYWLWRMGGGAQSMLVSMDRTTLAKTYEDLAAEHDLKSVKGVIHLAGKYKNPMELLRLGSEFTEKMTRLGEARKAIDQGANPLEAAYSSREVTLDFAKMGSKARSLNMIIAFFNANVQGSVRMVNAFKDAPYRTTTKTLLGITLPSVLLALWNQQEPDWQEIPQWQKNLFWMIKVGDNWWRFPKPFELGILFGSMPERIVESMFDNDPTMWAELRTAALDGMTPGMLPTSVLPIVENVTNHSFFLDRSIVPNSAESLPAFAQYTAYTSDTAKEIGKWLNYSPAKVDNLIRGYFAGLGQYAVQGLDTIIAGVKGVEAPPKPAGTIADIPLIKAFAVREPIGSSSESVNRFYNKAEEARAAAQYFDQISKGGETAAAQKWIADHNAEISLAPFYEKVRKSLATIRNVQTLVRDSQNTSEVKKQKIDQLDRLMTNIAHMAITVDIQNADAVYRQIETQQP